MCHQLHVALYCTLVIAASAAAVPYLVANSDADSRHSHFSGRNSLLLCTPVHFLLEYAPFSSSPLLSSQRFIDRTHSARIDPPRRILVSAHSRVSVSSERLMSHLPSLPVSRLCLCLSSRTAPHRSSPLHLHFCTVLCLCLLPSPSTCYAHLSQLCNIRVIQVLSFSLE